MNKRLKYEKFKTMDNVITIDLHNDYTVIAIIGKDKNDAYDITLMLKENTVDRWDLIGKAEHLTFNVSEKTICSAILKQVATFLEKGFFDYYIENYEHELRCFEIGDELMKKERLSDVNAS